MVFKKKAYRQSIFATSEVAHVGYIVKVASAELSAVVQKLVNYSLPGGGAVEVGVQTQLGWSALLVAVRVDYSANATAGVRILWLYSHDGVSFDSVDDAVALGNYYDVSFAAGASRQATVLVPLLAPYVKVVVVNKDAANAATVNLWTWYVR